MHTDSVTYVNANSRPSFFSSLLFRLYHLCIVGPTCNFICGLSDVIIKTFSQSVSQPRTTQSTSHNRASRVVAFASTAPMESCPMCDPAHTLHATKLCRQLS